MAVWIQEKMMASASGQIGGVPNVGWFSYPPPYETCMFAEASAINSNIIRQRGKSRYLAIFEFLRQMK